MFFKLPAVLRVVLLGLLWAFPFLEARAESEARIPVEALLQDLQALKQGIAQTHPDPAFSTDPVRLAAALRALEDELRRGPLTRLQAWRAFARLNPLFADAHWVVNLPDREALVKAHLQAGGGLFPFAVQVEPSGELRIRAQPGGGATRLQGRRILRINGREAQAVVHELLAYTSGDTPAFRAELLSRRWSLVYWLLHGAPDAFELALEGSPEPLRVSASRELPEPFQTQSFEQTFHLQLHPEQSAAVLTLNAFVSDDKPRFHAFIEDVYARLKATKIRHLIIDVRANPGGDDDLWKGPLLRLVAKQPFRNASTYVKKVLAGRASGTEKVGDVVHGQVESWVQPDLENPLRFEGQVYVLVGRLTYSSAVLFANVVQDFGIGQLVGAGGTQRTQQSGGIQKSVPLPHTGLELFVPRFVLTRPSGLREPAWVTPDIVLPDNPFDTGDLVTRLLSRL